MKSSKRTEENSENSILFKKYKLKEIIGVGSFGKVYKGINIRTKEEVAIKLESKNIQCPVLEKEAYFLYSLKGLGIPEVKSFGYSGNNCILIEPLLGKTLYDIQKETKNHKLILRDICLIAMQLMDRIEHVHKKYIIHRDIKPQNFLVGNPETNLIYLIDFGLSKKYRSNTTKKHIQFKLTGYFTGTPRFASINSMKGCEQSRRDDLESIGYVLVYLYKNFLPWQEIPVKSKMKKIKYVLNKKSKTPLEEVCRDCPNGFKEYIKYTRKLGFEDEPNYEYLRGLFASILKYDVTSITNQFSWEINNKNKIRQIPVNLNKRKSSVQKRLFRRISDSLEKKKRSQSPEEYKKLVLGSPNYNISLDSPTSDIKYNIKLESKYKFHSRQDSNIPLHKEIDLKNSQYELSQLSNYITQKAYLDFDLAEILKMNNLVIKLEKKNDTTEKEGNKNMKLSISHRKIETMNAKRANAFNELVNNNIMENINNRYTRNHNILNHKKTIDLGIKEIELTNNKDLNMQKEKSFEFSFSDYTASNKNGKNYKSNNINNALYISNRTNETSINNNAFSLYNTNKNTVYTNSSKSKIINNYNCNSNNKIFYNYESHKNYLTDSNNNVFDSVSSPKRTNIIYKSKNNMKMMHSGSAMNLNFTRYKATNNNNNTNTSNIQNTNNMKNKVDYKENRNYVNKRYSQEDNMSPKVKTSQTINSLRNERYNPASSNKKGLIYVKKANFKSPKSKINLRESQNYNVSSDNLIKNYHSKNSKDSKLIMCNIVSNEIKKIIENKHIINNIYYNK